MPAIQDFRTSSFQVSSVASSGRDLGRNVYWRLYAIENVFRAIIHSILHAQIGPSWWSTAVDPTIQKKTERFRSTYARSPWHSSPGAHDIYYLDLSDLNEIARANSHLFVPIIPDIDQWIARIEQIRLPRNIVAHMNWLQRVDRKRIEVFQHDIETLASSLKGMIALATP